MYQNFVISSLLFEFLLIRGFTNNYLTLIMLCYLLINNLFDIHNKKSIYLTEILEDTGPADINVEKARMWYKSCMDIVKFFFSKLKNKQNIRIIKILDYKFFRRQTFNYYFIYSSDARKSRGLEPVISMLSEIGGWPLALKTEEWDENKYNWQEIDKYYSRNIGQNAFFSIDVIPNFETYDHMLSVSKKILNYFFFSMTPFLKLVL